KKSQNINTENMEIRAQRTRRKNLQKKFVKHKRESKAQAETMRPDCLAGENLRWGGRVIPRNLFSGALSGLKRLCGLCAPVSVLSVLCIFLSLSATAQTSSYTPDWCKAFPRPEYKALQRVLPDEPWFEVYKVSPGVFAIYEPHQAEETISYLIVGTKQALLFDTGMGIGNIRKVVTQLTSRPVVVLNSHTHDDHVGGNWQFPFIFA